MTNCNLHEQMVYRYNYNFFVHFQKDYKQKCNLKTHLQNRGTYIILVGHFYYNPLDATLVS